MYEWKTEYKKVDWVRFGETLIHVRNVNAVLKEGDDAVVCFANGETLKLEDTPVREFAKLVGFEEVSGDSTAQ